MPDDTVAENLDVPMADRLRSDDFNKDFKEALAQDEAKREAARQENIKQQAPPATTKPAEAAKLPGSDPVKPAPAATPAVAAEDETPPEIARSEKAASSWAKMKAAHREREQALARERDELATKFTAADKLAQERIDKAEYERLKQEAATYKETLRLTAIEKDPEFQRKYDTKINIALEEAKAIVGPSKANAVAGVLALPEGDFKKAKVAEVYAELDDLGKAEFIAVQRDLRKLSFERQQEIEMARKDSNLLGERQKAQSEAQARQLASVFDKEYNEFDNPMLKPKTDDPAHNEAVSQRLALARQVYAGESGAEHEAKAALFYASAPSFFEGFKTVMAERDALAARLAAMTASKPGVTGGEDTKPKTDEAADDGSVPFFHGALARAQAAGIR